MFCFARDILPDSNSKDTFLLVPKSYLYNMDTSAMHAEYMGQSA